MDTVTRLHLPPDTEGIVDWNSADAMAWFVFGGSSKAPQLLIYGYGVEVCRLIPELRYEELKSWGT